MALPTVFRTRFRRAYHLSRRFFESLSSAPPSDDDDHWIRHHLLPGEIDLWDEMSAPDQRHAIQVASDVSLRLPRADRAVIAAAALHDVGKVVSDYGTFARVAATLFWALVPGRLGRRLARRWAARAGAGRVPAVRRLGEYRLHPELGCRLLEAAGAEPLTAAWAAEHHQPEDRWTVDRPIGRILRACDND